MTVCAKQSVMLHRESVDNLHAVVDSNVKVCVHSVKAIDGSIVSMVKVCLNVT